MTPEITEAAPVRLAHLGLGAFHRAHQAWYTQRANELAASVDELWAIAAFTGRSPAAAEVLSAQGCRYTLIERGADADSACVIDAIRVAADGADVALWRATLADPAVAVLTVTITEAGYRLTSAGLIDLADPVVTADVARVRLGEAAVTGPGRIVDGLRARRAAASVVSTDSAPIALVSCDNLSANGRALRSAVIGFAAGVDASLAAWIDANASFVSTMVDRITPATTPSDIESARVLSGWADAAPVVTEPFSEWVLAGGFPAGRPDWHRVGARFVDDVTPFEERKLWLLNAAHSLLAYRGSARGHLTVAEAMLDPDCREAVEQLWAEARPILPFDGAEIDEAIAALRSRFANARIEHRLLQIAKDGSKKLGPRIVDQIRRRAAAGLPAGGAQLGVIAAWAVHLGTADRSDPGADSLAASLPGLRGADRARAILDTIAPDLARDGMLVAELAALIDSISHSRPEGTL